MPMLRVQVVDLTCKHAGRQSSRASILIRSSGRHPTIDFLTSGRRVRPWVEQPAIISPVPSWSVSIFAGSTAEDDPNHRIQRQTMLLLPLISVAYGGFLPAGLFIYWIAATIFSIVQQYLIVGWGGMFPVFGWTPGFATAHTPRFPVSMPPPPEPGKHAAILTDADKKTTAASTIRPRERGRQGRRGRRR